MSQLLASLHLYRVAGLRIASERPLDHLPPSDRAGPSPDVHIAFAPLAARPGRVAGAFEVHSPDSADLVIPGRLRIRVSGGRALTVDAALDVPPAEILTFLFGPAFAALLHQRGTPPLHAGAVALAGGAVAVAGASGTGKSTTVRALLRAGARLLTDDQMVIEPPADRVAPGIAAVKLWQAAAAHFDDPARDSDRVAAGRDKFHLGIASGQMARAPAPLRAVCILAPRAGCAPPCLERLCVPEAVMALGGLSHHAYVADAMGRRRAIFHLAADLAGRVPVFLLHRPDDLASLDEVAERVLEAAGQEATRPNVLARIAP